MGHSQTIPAVNLLYAPSGYGKTTDTLYSFPNGLFIGEPAAFKAAGWIGFAPKIATARTFVELVKGRGEMLRNLVRQHKPDAICIDDLSVLLTNTQIHYMQNESNGVRVWGYVLNSVVLLLQLCRELNLPITFTAHEQVPSPEHGRRGGAALQGQSFERVPALCDHVLRGVKESKRKPWPVVYVCDQSATNPYITKDRDGAIPSPAPMNTAEILRQLDYQVSRLRGLEWQEELVEATARALLDYPEDALEVQRALVAECAQRLRGSDRNRQQMTAWALRDALDRAALRRLTVSPLAAFGLDA